VVVRAAADRKLWAPGVEAPSYLNGELAGDYGWDPLGLGANPESLQWYRQAELVHCRWAMLGVAGVLGQEILRPDVFWYEAGLPENLPGPFKNINMGGLLAFEFLMMHFVEVRRWQDIKNFGSVNEDPIFKGNKVPNTQMGYPGGVFDPLGFSKGDSKQLQTKEVKNGRLAMVAFMGFVLQAQATGKGPLADLAAHLSNPFSNNIATNIGTCTIPSSVDVEGIKIPLTCLWPGHA
jgi:light-harvesting complex I chlorophyll a/b binding protein 4